ncbi:somatic embryogenesis receptor kinase 2 [Dorcoceras hygrometricum]|uniref:Somatic embryogenesis receptor kinase 2 n=1 Tax=Dorcoceras hygrometricum TaxID=472368 RepID=A0A2Z7C3H5_9LAMI|nr:somatic embryogenesis receptor kinase 2 [Dorcoceras hygrometricum]
MKCRVKVLIYHLASCPKSCRRVIDDHIVWMILIPSETWSDQPSIGVPGVCAGPSIVDPDHTQDYPDRIPAGGEHAQADRKPKLDTKTQPDRGTIKDKKEKKFYRKNRTEKTMVAEEYKNVWADTDSEESSSGTSSSSESEDELQCLMTDGAKEAEKESCDNKDELVSSSEIQAALSKLSTENEELRCRS